MLLITFFMQVVTDEERTERESIFARVCFIFKILPYPSINLPILLPRYNRFYCILIEIGEEFCNLIG